MRHRLLVPMVHALHRRNWDTSDAMSVLYRVFNIRIVTPKYGDWRRMRRVLRLGSLVSRARLGSRTYRHKLTLPRPLFDRMALAAWRTVRDPEAVARAIERRLPIRRDNRKAVEGCDLMLWPTMIHDDPADDLVKAAMLRGIPVVAAPASWDSLTTKGAFLVRPDALLVWGAASARHAERDHGFARRAVAVTGPPHWDHYSEPRPARPRTKILIAGTSVAYWRDEEDIAGRLTEDFPGRVLYRRHPRRGGEWSWKACLELRDQLDETAVVVAAFSTVIIEAALQGIPSCVVAFGRGTAQDGLAPLAEYEHMAEVLKWPGVRQADKYEELTALLRHTVDTINGRRINALRTIAREVADADGRCRERIAEALTYYLREGRMP